MRNDSIAHSTRDVAAPVTAFSYRAIGRAFAGVLAQGHEAELLAFLDAARLIHSATMSGLTRDNGTVSPLNRGGVGACRTWQGVLDGVASGGRGALSEACRRATLETLASDARRSSNVHVIAKKKL